MSKGMPNILASLTSRAGTGKLLWILQTGPRQLSLRVTDCMNLLSCHLG